MTEGGQKDPDRRLVQLKVGLHTELNETGLRHERPSPHDAVSQLQMDRFGQTQYELAKTAALASDMGDVIKVFATGRQARSSPADQELLNWLVHRYGPVGYSDAAVRIGSAYEGASPSKGSGMSDTPQKSNLSSDFNGAAKHEHAIKSLHAIDQGALNASAKEKLGAAIKTQQDKAESARHVMDQRSEAARQSFNAAAKAQQQSDGKSQQSVQSQQVTTQQSAPQLNMKGQIATEVNRKAHQERMNTDDKAAKCRDDLAKQAAAAKAIQEKRIAQGLTNTFNQKAGNGFRR